MAVDYEVRRFTRRCAASDRPLEPGEAYVSVLRESKAENNGDDVVRADYAADAWANLPVSTDSGGTDDEQQTIAWWRGVMPADGGRDAGAPRDVLLSLLDRWAEEPADAAARYLLALLLVRRRMVRVIEDGWPDPDGADAPAEPRLRLAAPDRHEPIDVPIVTPTADELSDAQARLAELVGASASG